MKRFSKPGFTIIETMLFLAISAMLIVAVLVGTGTSINIQRYRDSVTSLQSVLQEQFSEVANVNNGRDDNWECDSATGTVVKVDNGTGTSRGQTDCVVLGRLITSSIDGKSILVKEVVGSEPINIDLAKNDIDAIKAYNIQVSPVDSTSYEVQWSASMVKPLSDSPVEFSILILNSPLSGVTRTFISSNAAVDDSEVATLVDAASLTEPLKVCINSNGLFTGTRMAIFLNANTSGASGVETLGDNSGC